MFMYLNPDEASTEELTKAFFLLSSELVSWTKDRKRPITPMFQLKVLLMVDYNRELTTRIS